MDDDSKNFDAPLSALWPESLAAGTDSGAPRDGRRAILVGGVAAAPLFITLASRSALAASTACTISGMTSGIGSNHLPPAIGGCGSPPSCWATRVADWRGGFFQSTSFIATFMNGVSSQMSYPASSDSFDSCLTGTPTGIVVNYPGRKATSPPELPAQCVAAALNAALFGSDNTANGGADYYNHGSTYTKSR
ncbi:MAG: hypothetical protein JWL84_1026 [Rhodospirillales bacterium]|jgi:hypothetical protein|nr:hypothetical protein [Rhodospirillales bacterium]